MLLLPSTALAQPASVKHTFDAAGGLAQSANVSIRASLGSLGGISISRWTNVVVAQGFIGQVVTVRGPADAGPSEADLGVSLTDDPDPVMVGGYVTYTVTITNLGPDAASGITLAGELPANVDFKSATLSQGTRTLLGQMLTWNVGGLPPNSGAQMTVDAEVLAAGFATFTMTAIAAETDPNPANNTATQSTTAGYATNYVWNGANPGDWFIPANWTPNGVPGALDTATISSGRAVVNSDVAVANVNLGGGTLDGSAMVTTRNMSWTGTMRGSGATVILAGGQLTGTGGLLDGRVLQNNGTATYASLSGAHGAVVNNYGTWELRDNGQVSDLTFTNYGRLFKTSGSGTATFNRAPCYNRGMVEVQSGTLLMNTGGGSGTGLFTVAAGATWWINGACYSLEPGSRLECEGTVNPSGCTLYQSGVLVGNGTILGDLINNGQVGPGTSPGRLRIQGNYTQTANGALNIELGGLAAETEFDQLQITGTATLNGQLNVSLMPGFVPALSNRFQVLTCNSRSGTFASCVTMPPGLPITPQYGSTFVELLVEDEITLPPAHDFLWTGAVSGDWLEPGNWTHNGVPGEEDTATVTNLARVTADESLTVSNLNLHGTLAGTGNVTVIGTLHWTGGGMEGGGETVIAPKSLLTVSGDAAKLLKDLRVLRIEGTGAWTNAGAIHASNGAVFHNLGSFDVQTDASLLWPVPLNGPKPRFHNSGLLTKSAGTGTTAFSGVTFSNSAAGLVRVLQGTLLVGEVGRGPGSFTVAAGATLAFTNSYTIETGGSILSTGIVSVLRGGTVVFQGSQFKTPRLDLDGGIGGFSFPVEIDVVNLNWPGANLAGPDLIITNLNWRGGSLGGGTKTIPVGGVLNMVTSGARVLSGKLNHRGTGLWSDGELMLLDGAVLDNHGTLEIQSSQGYYAQGGTPRPAVNNWGQLIFSLSSGALGFAGATFTNAGMVELRSGTAKFNRPYGQIAGTTLLNGGHLWLQPGATIVDIRSGVLGGTGTVTGNVLNRGEIAPGDSTGVLHIQGNYTQAVSGVLTIELGGLVPGTEYDRLAVSGAAALDGTLNVRLRNGFMPVVNDFFTVVTNLTRSGVFASMSSDPLGEDHEWRVIYQDWAVDLRVQLIAPRFTPRRGMSPGGQFNLEVRGVPGQRVVLEGSENLLHWYPLHTNIIPANRLWQWNDPDSPRFPHRFYRPVLAP